ncbi:MAG: gliding motility-associated C-terminal domain-containing protein, partial [Bacteroidales bacterium]|nr:gliding motility-associated C-terminal domain-containing protein [Bacteroidales bacterium]
PSCIDNNDGSIIVATSGGNFPYIYLWSNNDTDSLADNLTAGTYYLTVTDNNGCETIKTYELPDGTETCLKIPDIFTPNGDGTNDTWLIEGIDLYPNATIEIYNRWGDLIFKSTGYNEPWDGTWNGKELPISSFIYIIDLHNDTKQIQGIVTIKK